MQKASRSTTCPGLTIGFLLSQDVGDVPEIDAGQQRPGILAAGREGEKVHINSQVDYVPRNRLTLILGAYPCPERAFGICVMLSDSVTPWCRGPQRVIAAS